MPRPMTKQVSETIQTGEATARVASSPAPTRATPEPINAVERNPIRR